MNDIYPTNNGDLRVTDYINCRNVTVKFINTGYKTTSQAVHIKKGTVRDRRVPSVFGVGFMGGNKHKSRVNKKEAKAYTTWKNMIRRCYCSEYLEKYPTYKGCSVDKEWHDFQVFAEWFDLNFADGLHLDKDIKVKGNKVYSADTCLFVSRNKNNEEACAKDYVFISPKGGRVHIYNLAKFCRNNNLCNKNMSDVHLGKRHSHKGWIAADAATKIDNRVIN